MTTLRTQPLDFKTQYRLGFSPLDDEIVVDFFCGGGGAGTRQECLWINPAGMHALQQSGLQLGATA